MISATLQIMSERSPSWRSTPLSRNRMPPPAGWPMALAGAMAPKGAERSKPLAMSQGWPAFLAAAWRSRRVRSMPAA